MTVSNDANQTWFERGQHTDHAVGAKIFGFRVEDLYRVSAIRNIPGD